MRPFFCLAFDGPESYQWRMIDFEGLSLLKDLEPYGQRVLLRADLDCPMASDGEVADVTKVEAALHSLRFLLQSNARIVVAAHNSGLGADGQPRSLEAIGALLAQHLDAEVLLPDEHDGPMARKLIGEQREGTIVLLENLARDARETSGDEALAWTLSSGIDLYVGDTLAKPHHYASLAVLPRLCKDRTLGIQAERELSAVNRFLRVAPQESLLVVGGEFEKQRDLLRWALRPGATIALGGRTAATLLAAEGADLQRTPVESSVLPEARTWLELARRNQTKVVLPRDLLVVGEQVSEASLVRQVHGLRKLERAVDLGPESVESIGSLATTSSAVLMIGDLSLAPQQTSNVDVQRLIAATQAFCIAVHGGLDTRISAADLPNVGARFVSTAGEAFSDAICGRRLAVVESLRSVG